MIFLRLFRSTIGKKVIMAVTGVLLFGFVVIHMVGNLQIFLGAEAINSYAAFLKSKGLLLWGSRLGLLTLVGLHIWAAISLTLENRAAHPEEYAQKKALNTSWASRSMSLSGIIVLAFIIFHILHFTVRTVPGTPEYNLHDSQGRHDVYAMIVHAYETPWIMAVYLIGVGLLSVHLSHGLQSMFRTIGWSDRRYLPAQILFARGFSAFIFLGMIIVPVAIKFNLWKF